MLAFFLIFHLHCTHISQMLESSVDDLKFKTVNEAYTRHWSNDWQWVFKGHIKKKLLKESFATSWGGLDEQKNLPDQCTHWFFLSNMHLNAICNTICFHSFLKWERAWVTYLYIKDGEDKCLVGGNQFPKSVMTGVWRMILIKITEFQK